MASVTNVFTDTIAMTYSGNGKSVSSKTGTYTGTKDAGLAAVVPAGSTNLEFDIVFPHATIQACIVACDQAVTVDVNSDTAPAPSLAVSATAAIVWGTDFANACPFTADVTKVFVTNAGATDARLNIRVLYN